MNQCWQRYLVPYDQAFFLHLQEQLEKEQAIEKAMEEDAIYSTPTPTPSADSTWLEQREIEVSSYLDTLLCCYHLTNSLQISSQ